MADKLTIVAFIILLVALNIGAMEITRMIALGRVKKIEVSKAMPFLALLVPLSWFFFAPELIPIYEQSIASVETLNRKSAHAAGCGLAYVLGTIYLAWRLRDDPLK